MTLHHRMTNIFGVMAVCCLVTTGNAKADLVAHFVSDDWSGSGTWNNRVAGKTDATIGGGILGVVSAGGLASDGSINLVNFDGSSWFNVTGGDVANNPFFGLTDYAITVVFTANNNTQVDGIDDRWWTHAGLVGNELPGGDRSDLGLGIDGTVGAAGLSDTRDYTADAPQNTGGVLRTGDIIDSNMHVMTMTRVISGGTADLALWLDGAKVGEATGLSNTADYFVTNPIEADVTAADELEGYVDGFAIGGNRTIGGAKFTGYMAEVQIDNNGGIDVAALHNSLVSDGVYQVVVPEPGTLLLVVSGGLLVALVRRNRRRIA
jgi:hypothetical protein